MSIRLTEPLPLDVEEFIADLMVDTLEGEEASFPFPGREQGTIWFSEERLF